MRHCQDTKTSNVKRNILTSDLRPLFPSLNGKQPVEQQKDGKGKMGVPRRAGAKGCTLDSWGMPTDRAAPSDQRPAATLPFSERQTAGRAAEGRKGKDGCSAQSRSKGLHLGQLGHAGRSCRALREDGMSVCE